MHASTALDDALKVVEEACQHGGPTKVHSEILPPTAVPTLVDFSKTRSWWSLVVAEVGGGCRLLGSLSSGLLRYAHCPVAIVHDWGHHPLAEADPLLSDHGQAPILVGIDGSLASELAIAIAFDGASRRNVGLVAVHAWSDVDVSEWPGIDWPAKQSMAEEVLAERLAGWQA